MLAFTEELHTLLSASYPLLYLVSHEETRTLGIVRQLSATMGKKVTVWRPEDHPDPGASYEATIRHVSEEGGDAVTVLVDAHPYIDTPERIRHLRVAARRLTSGGGTLVFISPTAHRPTELANDWTLVDVPLPDRSELQALLDVCIPVEQERGLDRERMAVAALGLTSHAARRAFERAKHLADIARGRRQPFDWEGAIVSEKRRLMSAAGALEFYELEHDDKSIGGLEELKLWMFERRKAFDASARKFGIPQPKGMLLVGVQGCGKSLAAKAAAGFWGLPLLRLDMSALFSSSHAPDDALRESLKSAEAMSPSVLWLDEIEKGFEEGDGETTRLLGSLLTWMQEKKKPVFFVATANRVQALPPELMRRGRFDEVFFVDLPDDTDRVSILQIHLRSRGRDPGRFDLAELARITDHYSGAELEQVVVSGLYGAFAKDRELTQGDLVVAARQLVPLYKMYETEIKALRTWAHERARPAGKNRKLVELFQSKPTS